MSKKQSQLDNVYLARRIWSKLRPGQEVQANDLMATLTVLSSLLRPKEFEAMANWFQTERDKRNGGA